MKLFLVVEFSATKFILPVGMDETAYSFQVAAPVPRWKFLPYHHRKHYRREVVISENAKLRSDKQAPPLRGSHRGRWPYVSLRGCRRLALHRSTPPAPLLSSLPCSFLLQAPQALLFAN